MKTFLGRTRRPYRAYVMASFPHGRLFRRPGTSPGAGARDQPSKRVLPIVRAAAGANEGAGCNRFTCRMVRGRRGRCVAYGVHCWEAPHGYHRHP